jgi:hypothetical protein
MLLGQRTSPNHEHGRGKLKFAKATYLFIWSQLVIINHYIIFSSKIHIIRFKR